MRNLIAAETPIGNPLQGIGNLGQGGSGSSRVFNNFLSGVIGILTVIAGIYFIFTLITGAISWMTAGGDKGRIEDARQRMTNGLIGLVIVIAAVFLVGIIGTVLGFSNILDPGAFINNFSFTQ